MGPTNLLSKDWAQDLEQDTGALLLPEGWMELSKDQLQERLGVRLVEGGAAIDR